jgi:hypothetical protein
MSERRTNRVVSPNALPSRNTSLELGIENASVAGTSLSKTTSSELARKDIFPFEKLPPELRNRIYEEALVAGGPIFISRYKNRDASQTMDAYRFASMVQIPAKRPSRQTNFFYKEHHEAAILRLNRTIYEEARPILYGKNTFNFAIPTTLREFYFKFKSGSKLIEDIELDEVGKRGYYDGTMVPSIRHLRLRSSADTSTLEALGSWIYENWVVWLLRKINRLACGHGYRCLCASNLTIESLSRVLELEMSRVTIVDVHDHGKQRKFDPTLDMEELMGWILKKWRDDIKVHKERVEQRRGMRW